MGVIPRLVFVMPVLVTLVLVRGLRQGSTRTADIYSAGVSLYLAMGLMMQGANDGSATDQTTTSLRTPVPAA
ncbi:hypothetical protein [Paenibacillus pabuli]|uniref:hypothetical protein n=1 Tax=Paenibacillus pabuli TaxID=1472 RepID=UPI001431B00A|nr:hypothetical protein [Paenibacillus pabuli]MEC0125767.1 hypothetical protein [Paenibacillus pabuli]